MNMRKLFSMLFCHMLTPAVCQAQKSPAQRSFSMGYAAQSLPVDASRLSSFYVAGYRSHWPATGVLDDQQVKAVVLDDHSGKGPVVLVSIDCVGLSSSDVKRIRDGLASFIQDTHCRALHITATHDHAGADTLGLWGPEGVDGKDAAFMEQLRQKTILCVQHAYASQTQGDLYFGWTDTLAAAIQEDTRKPYVFDSKIYSFRFVPHDSTLKSVRLINYAAHAESLDGSNSLISADFPAYVAKYLSEAEGSEMVWFPGAIGGLLRTRFIYSDRIKNCQYTAQIIAEKILSIQNEVRLEPDIRLHTEKFSVPCDNSLFVALKSLGVLEPQTHTENSRVYLDTELSYLSIGGKQILMVPGEIFPELVYGNDTNFVGNFPERVLPSLCSIFGEDLLIFGLTDDEIGYIVPPSDFMLSQERPYVDKIADQFGENHYEETNSPGPDTALAIYDAALRLKSHLD